MTKAVLTLATGNQMYIDMAVAMSRSFNVWNNRNDIELFIATDQEQWIPKDVLSYASIIKLAPKQFGEGFSPKLHLDEITVSDKTLFIDSDCLVVGDLSFVFEKFSGKNVSVVGEYMDSGEWFGDVGEICKRFDVPAIPKFNGGIYYLEKGKVCTNVYQKARELEPEYEKIGLKLLRNKPNDELLMAIAMAIYDQKVIDDDGTILGDPQACRAGAYVDVFKGESLLINPPLPHKLNQSWYRFNKVSPVVVHFLGNYSSEQQYISEVKKLKLVLEEKKTILVASLLVLFQYTIPLLMVVKFKNIFRPIYRFVFGVRDVQKNTRF